MMTLARIAIRNVVRSRRRTLITLAAIVVGVGVSVSIRGLLNGLQQALLDSVVLAQTGAVQVHRAGFLANVLSPPLTLDVPADEAMLAKVRGVAGVKAVSPRILFPGMVSHGDETVFFQATALDWKQETPVCPNRPALFTPGSRFEGDDTLLLGKELAEGVGAARGTELVLLAPDRDGALNGEIAHLGGEMEPAILGEMKFGVVPLALAQRLLRMEGRATELAIAVDRIDDAPRIAADLRALLGSAYEVHTWDEVATFVRRAIALQNAVLGVVATVFLVLMLLGIANTMLMSTLERTREIGTMMAVGVTRGRIAWLFLLEAAALGLLGGVSGAAMGAGLSAWLGSRGLAFRVPLGGGDLTLHPFLSPGYLVGIVALATAGSVVFALYPALRASALRPVQALAGK